MIERIISYIEFFILSQKYKQIFRSKEFVGLLNTKSIGLIYYVDDFETYKHIQSFISELQSSKININCIGVYSTKLIPSWSNKTINNNLFQEKKYYNLNILNSRYINNFIEKDFDILIDLSLSNKFIPIYISALSRAKLKLTLESENKKKYFDMFIKLKEPNIKDYIFQLKHYLSNIKN